PFLLPGKFETRDGYMLANSDRVYITIVGKGGHAASPHQTADAIALAGQFLSDVQNIVGRQISPLDPSVMTFGKILGGTKSNLITGSVELSGTVRTINPETQSKIMEKMESLLQSIADFWGGSYEYNYQKGYPSSWNEKETVDIVRGAAKKSLGEDSVINIDNPYLSVDDFSYLSHEVPSAFVYW